MAFRQPLPSRRHICIYTYTYIYIYIYIYIHIYVHESSHGLSGDLLLGGGMYIYIYRYIHCVYVSRFSSLFLCIYTTSITATMSCRHTYV